ncbi:2'-5' RNA ligase family protein [Pontibacter akesuensis]|nr:2'-5' RNA ligase family protein [Pontibacter akesuensis]
MENLYNQLWEDNLPKYRIGTVEVDPLLSSGADNRFGITLLFRPDGAVKKSIGSFLQELERLEPEQYYYPASDLHVTVISIISCHPGFSLDQVAVADYAALVKESLAAAKSFGIGFRGITISPAGILVQGFPATAQLQVMRQRLRENFKSSTLMQTLDSRYVLQTAHCTVARFKAPLRNPERLLQKLQEYRHHRFGSMDVTRVLLVHNDWYQKQDLVQQLAEIELPS